MCQTLDKNFTNTVSFETYNKLMMMVPLTLFCKLVKIFDTLLKW